MSDKSIKYSIVVPVYNSTESLILLVERIEKVFTTAIECTSWEMILVDDASTKKETWPVVEKIVEKNKHVRALQLTRNFGKNGALLCGMENAGGEFIITMDDDLQHRPEDIPALISKQDYDIVIGSFKNKKHPFVKKLFSSLNSWLEIKLLGKPANIKSSPFRLFKREVVEAMLQIKTAYPSIPAQMYYVTRNVANVEVHHDERMDSAPGFTFSKSLNVFSNTLINNSSALLKIIATIGIMISILSFCLAIFYVIKKITVGTIVPGWASLMVAILFIGGLILLSIGLVGEYLIRIINGVENKPTFIVRKKIE